MAMSKVTSDRGGGGGGGEGGSGFDVDRLLDFEKRTGVKDGEIDSFITKVDAVNAAIQAMKDGTLDPSEVHVDGVPTLEEERQMKEERRRRRQDMERRERENRERKRKEERDKWWTGAELLYGSRVPRTAPNSSPCDYECALPNKARDGDTPSQTSSSIRALGEEDKARLKERYSMEYSRWDKWTPQDPATLSEQQEREEEEEKRKSEEFEKNNADFCAKMTDDMKARTEAREKKENQASAARLKGNRFYKAKRWEQALDLYMSSLRAAPYAANTLANLAQTLIKLGRWMDAIEFCDRALHVDPGYVKALSRRATAFLALSAPEPPVLRTVIAPTSMPKEHLKVSQPVDVITTSGGNPSNESGEVQDSAAREVEALREGCGGRQGLMKLALVDLEKAVEMDPASEDVRHQRDYLKREMEEEKVEAEVMHRARKTRGLSGEVPSTPRATRQSRQSPTGSTNDRKGSRAVRFDVERQEVCQVTDNTPESGRHEKNRNDGGETSIENAKNGDSPAESTKQESLPGGDVEVKEMAEENDEIGMVDKLLQEALQLDEVPEGDSECTKEDTKGPAEFQGLEILLDPLLRLAALLEASSTARIYLRASGGLANLATAAAALTKAAMGSSAGTQKIRECNEINTSNTSMKNRVSVATSEAASVSNPAPSESSKELSSHGSAGSDEIDGTGVEKQNAPSREGIGRLGGLLSAVAAAMTGGERLAQQDVLRSGLLDGCGLVLQATGNYRNALDTFTSKERLADTWSTAGAAAVVIWRAAGDLQVRARVAGSIPILSGLIGLIDSKSAAPLAVQAAADTLKDALLGKTAATAVKSLRSMAVAAVDEIQPEKMCDGTTRRITSPAAVLGGALHAWRGQSARVREDSVDVGDALCGALANLALHDDFRGSFAQPISSRPSDAADRKVTDHQSPAADTKATTTARALVEMAGDKKDMDRSEARGLALAALMNACLHTKSAQEATFSAGGLALALAYLSLEGTHRAQNAPPLVAARSAGLMARLAQYPPALEAMSRPGVVERIIKAIVRSASLGGNLYSNASGNTRSSPTSTVAASIERENLVRVLATILRASSASSVRRTASEGVGMRSPSSNVQDNSDTQENAVGLSKKSIRNTPVCVGEGGVAAGQFEPPQRREHSEEVVRYAVKAAEHQDLAQALIHFLPPARSDGVHGITKFSVSLIPEWSAPPSLTANVCGCLLHLLGDSSAGEKVATQVVEVGGIPRLISLFANSGGSAALTARKNAAICLAKLARNPSYKKILTELRGMEMLVQAGSDLSV